ncbi:MAG TPA: Stk1 family PASTA domain-containing Ser/Thr kinase [Aeromicrobium sp.]|nr:Stk1 family PASTA domain-containing Ser/Thr kinase [Aeromicrobium sp.]
MTESDGAIRLGDRYELGGLLGRGGMADVRVARDLRLGRTVAIKTLRADLAADETFQARFRREAQSAAALNHPSIVAVYDTGEGVNEHGVSVPYIVMEYVEGQTLRDILRGAETGRKILPERALSIVADVLSALDYSHRSGIVHRDIKPANVMVTPSGQVKVMDFGIARAIADTSSAMTQTAAVIGTAQYLSPEQARGEAVDARSDIYSTGCLLYELLTGRPPFVGDSPVSVAYQHVREEARPPSQLNPDVNQSVDRIVARALAKRVDDRYQSAADMRDDLQKVLSGGSVAAPPQPTLVGAAPTAVTPAVAVPPSAPGSRRAEPEDDGGRWWIGVLIALLLLGAIVGGIYLFTTNGKDDPVMVAVPAVAGKEQQVAERLLTEAGFLVQPEEVESADIEVGLAVETDPPEGSDAEQGSTVTLYISSGPQEVAIPNLSNLTYENAKERLEALGFKVKKDEADGSAEAGRVLNTDPPAGNKLAVGETVTVIVSRGEVTVPNVVGMSLADAKKTLTDAGLEVTSSEANDPVVPAGRVVSQSVNQGQRVPTGTKIALVVSTGPPTPPPGDGDADADADGGP